MQQSQSLGGAAAASGGGGSAAQPKQKVRARRGQATDPHSIAERVGTTILTTVAVILRHFCSLFFSVLEIDFINVMSFLCFFFFLKRIFDLFCLFP